MTTKYLEIVSDKNVFLYDMNSKSTKPVAGFNQPSLSKKSFDNAKKQSFEIEEGLEPDNIYNENCITGLLKLRNQIDAIFTSPPYLCSKDYGDNVSDNYEYNDSMPYHDYLVLMKRFINSAYAALKEGGVFGLNISNVMSEGEKRPTGIDLLNIAIDSGFTFQEQIMWVKPLGAGKQRTGSYIISYQKYQDRLKLLDMKSNSDPQEASQQLELFREKKKEILAELREIKNTNDAQYKALDLERYNINNQIRVLSLFAQGGTIKENKAILEQEAAQVYHPNPISEYIWILTKGPNITNKTTIDLKQAKDQLYNVWYDKTELQLKESQTKSMISSDIDKLKIKDSIPDLAVQWIGKTMAVMDGAIEEMAARALNEVRPKLKNGSALTPTKINKALKEIYKAKVDEVMAKMSRQVVNKLKTALKHNEGHIKDALAESFAVFWRTFTDNWDIAPTNTKVRHHPAPFSVDLAKRFIELYLPKGGLIVDPFCGSASTPQAAVRLNKKYKKGYRWIGFDISEEYVRLANDFIRKEKNGTD